MDNSGWNMWVFRGTRKLVQGKWLVEGLTAALRALDEQGESGGKEPLLDALLWCGELECSLADIDSPCASEAAHLTDNLATALVNNHPVRSTDILRILERFTLPDQVHLSVQEGFAYYALHPLRFAEFVEQRSMSASVCVVGIRSIGSTLSAVVLAALRAKGVHASRITVRPTGHPYDRQLELASAQSRWISEHRTAEFLVVDEGPGLSGSSFLCTGEALEHSGVQPSQITFEGTRTVAPSDLRTTDGAARWTRFRYAAVSNAPCLPDGAAIPIGGGAWRERFQTAGSYTGSWTQLEPLKFLSADHRLFFRFEGYGRHGAEVAERARILAKRGFSPTFHGNVVGFGCYDLIEGNPLSSADESPRVIERIADYCAMRHRDFACPPDTTSDLENMLRFDWKTEFGVDLGDVAHIETVSPVIADGRMLPHKWICAPDGKLYKIDAVTHGDDHFFPGPCDIAWDLAGAIVEWLLRSDGRDAFLARYRLQSGDDARPRLPAYLLAYAIFRCAYCKMAAKAMGGTPEEALLHRDYLHYREQCELIFAEISAIAVSVPSL